MKVNEHIKNYLDYYCQLEAPDYAVLLSGKWGCGKSHFISQYQETHKDSRKFIYVSLYGLQNTSQIDDSFFEQLHPVLSSKGMDIAGKVVKTALRATLRFDLDGDDKSDGSVQLKLPDSVGFLNDSKDHILIFDDLERCCIPIAHVLGYINSFIEHHGRHVILIADESKIKGKKTYAKIKEKLIGQSFKVHADIDSAIDFFCPKISNHTCQKFLIENKDFIREMFVASKYNNLRVLKKIIQDFDHIFELLPDEAQNKKELLLNMFGTLVVLSFEVRCGKVAVNKIGKLLHTNWDAWLGEAKSDDPLAKLQKKYQAYLIDTPVPDVTLWKDYMKEGIFNPESLQRSVLNSSYFQDETTPDWMRLWYVFNFDDASFSKLLSSIEQLLQNREYKKVPEIKHVFGLFLWMAENDLYNKKTNDVVEFFKSYIDRLIADNELEFKEDSLSEWDDSHAGLQYKACQLPEFSAFSSHVDAGIQKIKATAYPVQAEALLEVMKGDTQLFYQQVCLCNSGDTKYHNIPIFNYVTPKRFIDALVTVPPKELFRLADVFKQRYEFGDFNKLLLEELEWLKSVKKLLSAEAETHKGKISGYVFQRIIDDGLSTAITNLQLASESVE